MIKPSPSIEYYQYPNLYIERPITLGNRLVIVAEADKGELFDPTLVYSIEMAYDIFGGGPLLQAYDDISTFNPDVQPFLVRMDKDNYQDAFSMLEAFDFDLLFIHGVHYNTHVSVFEQFLEFAKNKEEKGNLVHAITSFSDSVTHKNVDQEFASIQALSMENGDETIENGKYLSIALNQISGKDAGAVYAGVLATLSPEVSPVNKQIKEIELLYDLNKQQIKTLRDSGVVCFRNTFKNGVTCTSSSCAVSTVGSVHQHISNFRIAQTLINHVALELQPFIGTTHIVQKASNIEDIVDSICMEHVSERRLKDYQFSLEVFELRGVIDVEIEFVPIFSVHAMNTHTRVRIFK